MLGGQMQVSSLQGECVCGVVRRCGRCMQKEGGVRIWGCCGRG